MELTNYSVIFLFSNKIPYIYQLFPPSVTERRSTSNKEIHKTNLTLLGVEELVPICIDITFAIVGVAETYMLVYFLRSISFWKNIFIFVTLGLIIFM